MTLKLYTFDGLSEDVQKKLIRDNFNINTDNYYWHDDILCQWREKLESMGFESPEIMYRGFASQGDGACFTCESVDVVKLIRHEKDTKRFKGIMRNIDNGNLAIDVEIKKTDHMYSHYNTVGAFSEWFWYGSDRYHPYNENNPSLDRELSEIKDYVIEVARDYMREIYRELDELFYSLCTDDAIREALMDEELPYMFREDGTKEYV